jgi:hypothetical protein
MENASPPTPKGRVSDAKITMIKLAQQLVTTTTSTINGVVTTTTADTLLVDGVNLNLTRGTVMLKVRRGTMSGSPPAFVDTQAALTIVVAQNGSFYSTDQSWKGTFSTLPALMAMLQGAFDQAILSSGYVTGTEVAG